MSVAPEVFIRSEIHIITELLSGGTDSSKTLETGHLEGRIKMIGTLLQHSTRSDRQIRLYSSLKCLWDFNFRQFLLQLLPHFITLLELINIVVSDIIGTYFSSDYIHILMNFTQHD